MRDRGCREVLRLCALLMVAASASGDTIDVDLVESVTVQARGSVSVACGGRSSIGCTVFTGMKIVCGCSFEESQWRIRWAIRGNAATFVTTPRSILHEAQHVKDLRGRLESFATQLENARFDTEAGCSQVLDSALKAFPNALHDVVRINVLEVDRKAFDPSQIVQRREPDASHKGSSGSSEGGAQWSPLRARRSLRDIAPK